MKKYSGNPLQPTSQGKSHWSGREGANPILETDLRQSPPKGRSGFHFTLVKRRIASSVNDAILAICFIPEHCVDQSPPHIALQKKWIIVTEMKVDKLKVPSQSNATGLDKERSVSFSHYPKHLLEVIKLPCDTDSLPMQGMRRLFWSVGPMQSSELRNGGLNSTSWTITTPAFQKSRRR
jgi:hypothetical protein